jgi:hypothetical protein
MGLIIDFLQILQENFKYVIYQYSKFEESVIFHFEIKFFEVDPICGQKLSKKIRSNGHNLIFFKGRLKPRKTLCGFYIKFVRFLNICVVFVKITQKIAQNICVV